ncbi:MAG: hypothetical protein ABI890_13790 [Lapillicoccus sp.]
MSAPLTSLAALPGLSADASPQGSGFSWTNLVIVIIIAAVAWPIYRRIRTSISRGRRERWAREEEWPTEYTRDNDPDLRRDPQDDDPGPTSRSDSR